MRRVLGLGGDFDPNTHLSLTDISLDTSGRNWAFTLSIKISKMNQFRNRAQVVLGATNSDLHPVAAQFEDRFQGRLYRGYGKPLKRKAFTTSVEQALLAVAWLELSSTGTALELGLPPLLVPLACLIPQSSLWGDGQAMLFRAIFTLP